MTESERTYIAGSNMKGCEPTAANSKPKNISTIQHLPFILSLRFAQKNVVLCWTQWWWSFILGSWPSQNRGSSIHDPPIAAPTWSALERKADRPDAAAVICAFKFGRPFDLLLLAAKKYDGNEMDWNKLNVQVAGLTPNSMIHCFSPGNHRERSVAKFGLKGVAVSWVYRLFQKWKASQSKANQRSLCLIYHYISIYTHNT